MTQVVSADRGHVFHNRLTHSLKVGQLARRMAEGFLQTQPEECAAWGGIDPDVAEAAGLAHDMGHPPFGHVAEELLDDLVRSKRLGDGFEGNAQSFRIVTKLAVSDALDSEANSIGGLNLTRATLNAILKYPWMYGQNPKKKNKWGAYSSEEEIFEWVRGKSAVRQRSLEAELMDYADDITFAIHDLIDFFCVGQIPLERLGDPRGIHERKAFFDEVFTRCPDLAKREKEFNAAFEFIFFKLVLIDRRYTGSNSQRRYIWRLATVLISRFISAIKLQPNKRLISSVKIEENAQDEIRVLKELTWHYVIVHHDLAAPQRGLENVIETLFDTLLDAASTKRRWKVFPVREREQIEKASTNKDLVRIVTDYISSMTEKEALRGFRTLTRGC